ncbi:MAG: cupin domain-containing protein, partial [Ramlibacter sp.]
MRSHTAGHASEDGSTLYLVPDCDGALCEVLLVVRGPAVPERFSMAAAVNFGGAGNPLMHTLPDEISLRVGDDQPALRDIARAFLGEASAPRCGGRHALQRLGELLVLMLLRAAIERGSAQPSLLAGLSHPQLHPVL